MAVANIHLPTLAGIGAIIAASAASTLEYLWQNEIIEINWLSEVCLPVHVAFENVYPPDSEIIYMFKGGRRILNCGWGSSILKDTFFGARKQIATQRIQSALLQKSQIKL